MAVVVYGLIFVAEDGLLLNPGLYGDFAFNFCIREHFCYYSSLLTTMKHHSILFCRSQFQGWVTVVLSDLDLPRH